MGHRDRREFKELRAHKERKALKVQPGHRDRPERQEQRVLKVKQVLKDLKGQQDKPALRELQGHRARQDLKGLKDRKEPRDRRVRRSLCHTVNLSISPRDRHYQFQTPLAIHLGQMEALWRLAVTQTPGLRFRA